LTAQEVDERLASIQPQLTYDGFGDTDIIIEAVFENMSLKKQVFGEIDRIAKGDCVLASNTSTLDIDEIAGATSRPNMVIGIHFFSPAHVMRLVEVVRAARTDKEVIATAMALTKRLRKVGALVGNCRGFVGNRMMLPYMREAQFLVEEGATPSQVDQALYDFGMAMGIFAVDDMGGLDLGWRVLQDTKRLMKPGDRTPLVLEKLYEMHRWGQKTGAGWYRYEDGRTAVRDPEVEALIETTAKQAGIARRAISNEEIIERCVYVRSMKGAFSPKPPSAPRHRHDLHHGYGFPAYRGGPMGAPTRSGFRRSTNALLNFTVNMATTGPAPLRNGFSAMDRLRHFDAANEEYRAVAPQLKQCQALAQSRRQPRAG
jgi:3-hydroxyacyl-CoA dehydrogenase